MGDGGGAGDDFGNGQNAASLLGGMLRIDLDGDPYATPPTTTRASTVGLAEKWAIGLRNPWRWAFDGDDLWIADVGQGSWEEINLVDVGDGDMVVASTSAGRCSKAAHCYAERPLRRRRDGGPGRRVLTWRGLLGHRRVRLPGERRSPGSTATTSTATTAGAGSAASSATAGASRRRTGSRRARSTGLTGFGVDGDGELYVTSIDGSVYRIDAGLSGAVPDAGVVVTDRLTGHMTDRIVVVGSINRDTVVGVDRIPVAGETVLGRHLGSFPGGKGANQAVAAARLGRQVAMVGRVGSDAFGAAALDGMAAEGIDTDRGRYRRRAAHRLGDHPGRRRRGEQHRRRPRRQREVSAPPRSNRRPRCPGNGGRCPRPVGGADRAVAATLRGARDSDRANAAPARPLPEEIMAGAGVLVVNAAELAALGAGPEASTPGESSIEPAASASTARWWSPWAPPARWCSPPPASPRYPRSRSTWSTPPVPAMPSVAGSPTASPGAPTLEEATRWAVRVAALATTRLGAQEALPTTDRSISEERERAADHHRHRPRTGRRRRHPHRPGVTRARRGGDDHRRRQRPAGAHHRQCPRHGRAGRPPRRAGLRRVPATDGAAAGDRRVRARSHRDRRGGPARPGLSAASPGMPSTPSSTFCWPQRRPRCACSARRPTWRWRW